MKPFPIFELLIGLALIIFGENVALAQSKNFSGAWASEIYLDRKDVPYSVFNLTLHEGHDGVIFGRYCFVTRYGGKIDCGLGDENNIYGRIEPDGQHAKISFNSFWGSRDGKADLTRSNDVLLWKTVKDPKGDVFYGPYSETLRLKPNGPGEGMRKVVVDRAFLLDSPSSEERSRIYVVKGDIVKLLDLSKNLKFWKIAYVKKDGATLGKWIDCRAIDSCP